MAFKGTISAEKRPYIRLGKWRSSNAKELAKECDVSLASIYCVWKAKTNKNKKEAKRSNRGGRPQKLSLRHKRSLLRNINKLREENSNFFSEEINDQQWNKR